MNKYLNFDSRTDELPYVQNYISSLLIPFSLEKGNCLNCHYFNANKEIINSSLSNNLVQFAKFELTSDQIDSFKQYIKNQIPSVSTQFWKDEITSVAISALLQNIISNGIAIIGTSIWNYIINELKTNSSNLSELKSLITIGGSFYSNFQIKRGDLNTPNYAFLELGYSIQIGKEVNERKYPILTTIAPIKVVINEFKSENVKYGYNGVKYLRKNATDFFYKVDLDDGKVHDNEYNLKYEYQDHEYYYFSNSNLGGEYRINMWGKEMQRFDKTENKWKSLYLTMSSK